MDYITELAEIVNQEAEVTEALVEALKDKQKAFTRCKPEELEPVVQKEINLLYQMADLEKRRTDIVKTLKPHAKTFKVSALVEEYGTETLKKSAARLKKAAQEVLRKNNQNKQLLKLSMDFVQHTLSIVTNNYQKQLLDTKV
jgi:hypothetical protein